jgi:hypothetical protein
MKVNENLIRRKTEVAKVAAAEKETKKTHDVPPTVNLVKKTTSKRKAPRTSEKDKGIVVEEQPPEAVKPQGKKSQTNPTAEMDESLDVLAMPQIQPSTFYPPKAKGIEEPKDQPAIVPTDPTEEAEIDARSERAQIYFSSTCLPVECMKQTPEEEATSKRYWDHYKRTGEFPVTGPVLEKCVAGLTDVIDETEKLCYLDDCTPMEISERNSSASMPDEAKVNLMSGEGQDC